MIAGGDDGKRNFVEKRIGEKQKLAFAGVLAMEPKVIIVGMIRFDGTPQEATSNSGIFTDSGLLPPFSVRVRDMAAQKGLNLPTMSEIGTADCWYTWPRQLAWMGFPSELIKWRNPTFGCNLGVGFYFRSPQLLYSRI